MFERLETWLKGVCIFLALFIVFVVVWAAHQSNPLAHVVVPSPPTLPADTNSVAASKGTNPPGAQVANGTNLTSGTNSPLTTGKATNVTNNVVSKTATNQVASSPTNPASAAAVLETNKLPSTNESAEAPKASASAGKAGATNSAALIMGNETNKPATNSATSGAGVPPALATATNAAGNHVAASTADSKTNAAPSGPVPPGRRAGPGLPPEMAGMMGLGMGGPGAKLPELPPLINARIEKITDSEILAPVMHPQPLALLGIAGDVAFLRSPSGQTGLLKESETLGEIKLLCIGTNRVLVEQDGQKKELTIFSGYGGETLLPKTNTTNEPAK
jgi:hypothetical protein